MKSYKKFRYIFIIYYFVIFCCGCKKAVTVDPPISGLISATVFANNNTAASAVTSIYINMSNSGLTDGGISSIHLQLGLLADEFKLYSSGFPNLTQMYTNRLDINSKYFWTEIYKQIYSTNLCIKGLNGSTEVNSALKQQLLGESLFMRAFYNFYATNLYGDVPLVLATDYRVNNVIAKSPKAAVFQQIILDLKNAQTNLSDEFKEPNGTTLSSTQRVRPNKGAATALLARTYLYTEDWKNAEVEATKLISNKTLYDTVSLDKVFLANSKEAIWQIQATQPGANTLEAQVYVLTSEPGDFPPVALDSVSLTFETKDLRAKNWVGKFESNGNAWYYPFKYKEYLSDQSSITEYLMVLRLAEQYLIRAEARVHLNNISGAQEDLNVIRKRAGLPNASAGDQASLLSAILKERQRELFTEWGHRWFDLKRTHTIDDVMKVATPLKGGGTWNPDNALFPIPQSEIRINPNLTQNKGY